MFGSNSSLAGDHSILSADMKVSCGHLCKMERRVRANAIERVPLLQMVRFELETPARECGNVVAGHTSGPVYDTCSSLGVADDGTPLFFEKPRLGGEPVHVIEQHENTEPLIG